MANDLTKSPWLLDTTGDLINAASGLEAEMRIMSIKVIGIGNLLAGQSCKLEEYPDGTNTRIVWDDYCPAVTGAGYENEVVFPKPGLLVRGLKITLATNVIARIHFYGS